MVSFTHTVDFLLLLLALMTFPQAQNLTSFYFVLVLCQGNKREGLHNVVYSRISLPGNFCVCLTLAQLLFHPGQSGLLQGFPVALQQFSYSPLINILRVTWLNLIVYFKSLMTHKFVFPTLMQVSFFQTQEVGMIACGQKTLHQKVSCMSSVNTEGPEGQSRGPAPTFWSQNFLTTR